MDDEKQEELINHIRKWIKFDEDIKNLQKDIRQLKQEKKQLTNALVDIMRDNEIGEINTSTGKLIYTTRKTKKSISKKYLTSILSKFFEEDATKATELSQYILNNREEVVRENIRRKIKK